MGATISSVRWHRWTRRLVRGAASSGALPSRLRSRRWPPAGRSFLPFTSWAVIGTIVLGLSLVGLWAPGAYARPSSDREEEGLLGPVRLVVTQEAFLTQTDRYDAAGWLVERLQEGIQSAQRLWPLRFLYEYDPGGEGRAERVWDGLGELVKETRVVYDARGQRIAEVAAWSDGTFDNASFYTYDPEGRRVSGLHYNATAVINRNTCSYDHQGRLIRERFARNYQYDARGQLVVTPNLFEFGYEVLSTYDAQGHVREKIVTDLSGHPQTRSEFEYDERGNQIEERTYNERGTLTDHKQYRYEYDPVGNWTSENLNWYRLSEGTSRPYRTQARIRTIQYH